MIELFEETRDSDPFTKYIRDEYRPTHALAASHNIATVGYRSISVTYWFGSLDAEGTFARFDQCPALVIDVPNSNDPLASKDEITAILANLLDPDVAPDPVDPRISVSVPGKHENDWKMRDLDAVCAFLHPRVRGRVV